MDVSENSGTPKSSILIGFSIINHPFWGTFIFGNTQVMLRKPSKEPTPRGCFISNYRGEEVRDEPLKPFDTPGPLKWGVLTLNQSALDVFLRGKSH